MRFILLVVFLVSCNDEDMNVRNMLFYFSQGQFTPSQLSGVRFWFKGNNVSATGSNVDSLTNLISGESDAVKFSDATRPQIISGDLNGHDVIDFNGTDQYLRILETDWNSLDHTWFIVFKSDDPSPGTRQTLVDCWSGSTSGFHIGLLSSQTEFYMRATTVQAFTDTASYHVIMCKSKHYANGNDPRVFKVDNGTPVNSVIDLSFVNLASYLGIGGRQDGTLFFNGKIAEIIGVEDVVNETDELKVYQYLNTKYGLSIPTTMPEYTFNSNPSTLLTYSSTFDAITDLKHSFSISGKTFGQAAPLLVLMHGYQGTVSSFTSESRERIANLGFYVLVVGMRQRNLAGGIRDSSGREILDIYDSINERLSVHTDLIDGDKIQLSGYSGGGGNGLACAAKLPELFGVVVDNFGMSDYVFNYATTAWFEQLASGHTYQQQLELDIFGLADRLPADYLNEGKSRDHRYSAVNNYEGTVFIVHDVEDTEVEIIQTDELWKQYVDQSKDDQVTLLISGPTATTRLSPPYTYNITDDNRYLHGNPSASNPGLIASEAFWVPIALTTVKPTSKLSGTYRVSGFVKNNSFQLFLGLTSADGKSCEADLVFNYATNSYTITPIFYDGETQMEYSFEDDLGRVSSGTITGATNFTPS